MAYVVSLVQPPCVRSLVPRSGLGRVVDCARGRGSGESLLALEDGARASRCLRSRPGLGEWLLAHEAGARASR